MQIPRPEGFRVEELPGTYEPGEYTHFTLWKRKWNTFDAIKEIAKKLGVGIDRFGYAGLKDRNAITTQRVSAWRVPSKRLEKVEIKGIRITDIKEGLEKIRLGTHKGNKFTIILEGVKTLRNPEKVPNLFGPQRFGGTELLGKALIERDWNRIIKLLKENPKGSYEKKALKQYERTGNALAAVKGIDKRIRVLWVNARQSWQWNKELDTKKETQELPPYPAIPEMPELGRFPGGTRATIMKVENYSVEKIKKGVKLEFTLPTGSYATVLIDYMLYEV